MSNEKKQFEYVNKHSCLKHMIIQTPVLKGIGRNFDPLFLNLKSVKKITNADSR